MKNLTISLDDDTYKRARIIAAERGMSVSALVRQFLVGLARGGDEKTDLKRMEQLLRDEITNFRGGDRVSREETHHRDR